MASNPPDAFLSYTRFDDRHDGDAISEFRRRLADAVRAVTGESFQIFQDVDGIGLGEHWPGKLDEMLEEARFFIPILTPSFFRSQACRDELEKFLKAEKDRGRNDLVLPIYYIRCRLLEDPSLRQNDPRASASHERQREDWRERRFRPFEDPEVRRSLEALAYKIDDARRRASEEEREWEGKSKPALKGREPGTVFRDVDAPWCPEMVVMPPGEFLMGSTEAELRWAKEQGPGYALFWEEEPQHLVRIAYPLAVGRYPLTFEEYGHFARATGRAQPNDRGWGRGRRPVINVSWEDAKAYVEWLAAQTGKPYRLLSEAEWEYACRAGTTTRYSWGDEITPENANYGRNVGKTSEVGSYRANPWGLFDMHGNVWEWVEDCWHYSYDGAPDDGSAWIVGDFGRVSRVMRGGLGRQSEWPPFGQTAHGLQRICCPRSQRSFQAVSQRRVPGRQLNLYLVTTWVWGVAPVDFLYAYPGKGRQRSRSRAAPSRSPNRESHGKRLPLIKPTPARAGAAARR